MTAPEAAATVFGDRLPLAERFADWLTDAGITRGLIGPREAEQIWERHLLNGAAIADLMPRRAIVIDLGSGAGLPGIPVLLARPDLQMVLVEPKARRAAFLDEVCADLGLPVRVVRARATPGGLVLLPEGASGAPLPLADVVTARAVASVAELARWAVPLLRPGGRLVALKGTSADEELGRDRQASDRLGMRRSELLTLGMTGVASATGSVPTATVIAMTYDPVSRET